MTVQQLPNTLSSRLSELVEQRGDDRFIVAPRSGRAPSWTYREFHRLVTSCSSALKARGVERGSVFALMSATSVESIALMFGAYRLGAVAAMVNPASAPREVAVVVRKSGASFLVADDAAVTALGPGFDAVPVLNLGELGTEEREVEVPLNDDADIGATMIFTSGTTSEPKAVTYTHGHQWHGGSTYAANLGMGQSDILMHHFPLFHMNGLNQLGAALVSGSGVVLLERFRSSGFDSIVAEFRPTVTFLNGTHVKMLRAVGGELAASSLDRVGLALQMDLSDYDWFEGKFEATLVEGYGQTESVTMCLSNPLAGPHKRQSCGIPIQTYQAKLVDADGVDVPQGAPGHLLLRSSSPYGVMEGYVGDPETTAATLVGGWLRTGDILRQDEDGYYYYIEREKDIIKRAGENISASELESVIEQFPGVTGASVVGRPDALREELPVAFVVVDTNKPFELEELIEHCRRNLAAFKVPVDFVMLDEFPRTSVGKIEKRTLRDWSTRHVGDHTP